jgi:AcrR family transcriptional regulator
MTASLIARALAEDTPGDELADRILDATVEEIGLIGLADLAIESVARRAGTTRMTVYRRFGRREQLIEAMAVRETRRFIAELEAATASLDRLQDRGAEAFVAGLRFMHSHPVARRAIESEPEAIVQYLEADDGLVLKISREFVTTTLCAARLQHPNIDALAETVVRIFVSFLLIPRSVIALGDERAARDYVHDCLAPLVNKLAVRSSEGARHRLDAGGCRG